MRLVVATRNEHKLRELRALLRPHQLLRLADEVALPPERGATFAENALAKARVAAGASDAPAIGDDSGIESAALGGAPGVQSARFAGDNATDDENLAKLLEAVPSDGDRRVSYFCVLAYVDPSGAERLFEGRCDGLLAERPRGSKGFGYDPAFVPLEGPDGRTMAELSAAEKDAISHRGRAARALAAWLETDRDAA